MKGKILASLKSMKATSAEAQGQVPHEKGQWSPNQKLPLVFEGIRVAI